jgi:peptide/nickel transport system substrate-binding protein
VLEGYGGLVDAAYGMAQWQYQARRRELASRLLPIAFNLDRANDLLDQTIWTFEADGRTAFDRSKVNAQGTYMRHNAAGEMLTIRHISAAPSIGGAIESETLKNSPLIGMKYELTNGDDFGLLLDHYYEGATMGADRTYHAFNLATNFTAVDDKWISWHSEHVNIWWNASNVADPELDRITVEMRELDPTQTDRHADLWVDFQVRWQQILPQIPLYSNEYFDIHNSVVISVPTTPYANYQDVICQIHKWP